MKKIVLLSSLILYCAWPSHAQWKFIKEIKFPAADTLYTQPYLCTVTSTGRLYVTSSNLTSILGRNMIFYADENDVIMKKMIDYTATRDADTSIGDIGFIRGIASVGKDILINASAPFPRSKQTVGTMYYYPNGDTAKVQKYGFYYPSSSSGHGTHHHGVALTKDTIAVAGVSAGAGVAGPRPRFYNFTNTLASPAKGVWIGEGGLEIGGAHTGGVDVIRDVAVLPNGNYNDSTMIFYTSRNSVSSNQLTGGIAVWSGGRQTSPTKYVSQRVQDPIGLLSFGSSIICGITVDKNGLLWVAGIDSTRRWVKAFDMSAGIFASEMYELPSKNSGTSPEPAGAPMIMPVDVALTSDAKTAYVVDAFNRAVYQFQFGPATGTKSLDHLPASFALDQNFPNPFNPSTMISFTLPKAMQARVIVTNTLGQVVHTVADGFFEAGKHVRLFDAYEHPSGIYFYSLMAGTMTLTKKMVLVR
ncbi:MAG: T9SS type A sorting domain-containing protein [bacterium]